MTDKQETKRQAFQRIRDIRLPKILKSVKLLGNLSRKNQYEYTPAQAIALINSLYKAVDAIAKKFGVETLEPIETSTLVTPPPPSSEPLSSDARADIEWGLGFLIQGNYSEAEILIKRGLSK